MNAIPPRAARLPFPYRDEAQALEQLLGTLHEGGAFDWPAAMRRARPWVQAVRDEPAPFWAVESLLREYPISTAEGLALMRLAEALLRVPDVETAIALTADQLGKADFDGASASPNKLVASLSAKAIALSKKLLPDAEADSGLFKRLGAQTVVAATVRAIQLLGRQFVLGRNMAEAMAEAASQRKGHPQLRFSYDMLGEGARTEADARRYLAAYLGAIQAIAGGRVASDPESADGFSIKLSALFSRYEDAQRERVFAELVPRIWQLIEQAAKFNMNLTIDAEESDRLELSLDVFEALAARIAQQFPRWRGFGLAVQAYQTRALDLVHEVARIARAYGLRFMVRLTKGAYWDGEVKRAQELGLPGYPVFTHKHHTDIAYLACAKALIAHADVIYPQFASHNAGTVAAILNMADAAGASFELQRLHGMGEAMYREVSRYMASPAGGMTPTPPTPPAQAGGLMGREVPVRIYAPVGEHRDLLAYLVRRLLENGANSSFVHQMADESIAIDELLASPLRPAEAPSLPMPVELFGPRRRNSLGVDFACVAQCEPVQQAVAAARVEAVAEASPAQIDAAMESLHSAGAAWDALGAAARAAMLQRAADALEARLPEFCGLLVKEAHKTLGDCVAEVREAVDFLRYYAGEAEHDGSGARGRGVFVCISPWNFPLAIFAGQVAAALAAGNTIAAKPAEQTPAVAARMVALLHAAGVPADALVLLHGPGETVGAALVAHARTAGVCFTGSTAVAKVIHRALAARPGPIVPLIAETGGINAMIVDSSALPEQVVDAVVQSAFRSAGQRCSALRLLCVHEGIAGDMMEMIAGALNELQVGDPALLATDVGPVIDGQAQQGIARHVQRLEREARLIGRRAVQGSAPGMHFIEPVAFEVARIADVSQEIFGPVLHVVRWSGSVDEVMAQINALGYGLTLGIQTRIDSRALRLAAAARIGNVYVNRNMIGAVVGVQPFGGEGLSGTGPKAGGPFYLRRFAGPREDAQPQAPSLAPQSLAAAHRATWAIDTLQPGFSAWSSEPLAQRAALLRRAASSLDAASAELLRALADAAERDLATRTLPGPTGESNELRLHGRGVFLCLASGADALPSALAAAVGAALLAGNAVALLVDGAAGEAAADTLQRALAGAGLPDAALQRVAGTQAQWLAEPGLAGLCLTAPAPSAEVQRQWAARSGAILPLIGAVEARDARQIYRFAAEQTLTINTAAAGGNAALLASLPLH